MSKTVLLIDYDPRSIAQMRRLLEQVGVRIEQAMDGRSGLEQFAIADGLTWKDPAGRTRTERDLVEHQGKRASAGRMAPRGFPRDNRFT